MSRKIEAGWLGTLTRSLAFRRAVVLTGNTGDIIYCTHKKGYRQLSAALLSHLEGQGFTDVVLWDRIDGVQNITPQVWEELVGSCLQSKVEDLEGESYLDGAFDAEENDPTLTGSNDPSRFFPVAGHHLQKSDRRRKSAFVVDLGQFLFGNANALSEAERWRRSSRSARPPGEHRRAC